MIIFVLWSHSVYFPKTSRTSPHYPRDQTHTFICSPGRLKRWKFERTFSSPPCGGLCWLLLWPWFYFRVIFRQNQSRLVPACASQLLPNNWLVWSQVTVPGFNAIKLPPKNFQSPTSNTSRRGEIVGRPRSFFFQTNPPPSKKISTWPPTASRCRPPLPFDVLTRSVVLKHSKHFENIWIGDGSNGRLGRARSTHLQICKWLKVMKIIDDHWSLTNFTNYLLWWRCSMIPDRKMCTSHNDQAGWRRPRGHLHLQPSWFISFQQIRLYRPLCFICFHLLEFIVADYTITHCHTWSFFPNSCSWLFFLNCCCHFVTF